MQHSDIPRLQQLFASLALDDHTQALSRAADLSAELRLLVSDWLGSGKYSSIPVIRAWELLNQGQWSASVEQFTLALEDADWLPVTALGLGRLATRLGLGPSARDWLLVAIWQTRLSGHDELLAKCHGALGELLLRQGYPRSALQQMQIAQALHPVGHPARQRLYSYLAMPLARLGQVNVAEDYYLRAFHLACDANDRVSALHAASRWAALALHGQGSAYSASLETVRSSFEIDSLDDLQHPSFCTPVGYLRLIAYWLVWQEAGPNSLATRPSLPLPDFPAAAPWEAQVVLALKGLSPAWSPPRLPSAPECPDPMQIRELDLKSLKPPQRIESPAELKTWLLTFFI